MSPPPSQLLLIVVASLTLDAPTSATILVITTMLATLPTAIATTRCTPAFAAKNRSFFGDPSKQCLGFDLLNEARAGFGGLLGSNDIHSLSYSYSEAHWSPFNNDLDEWRRLARFRMQWGGSSGSLCVVNLNK